MQILVHPETSPWERRVRMAGDKSLSHRARILGAMAEGQTILTGLSESRGVRSTLRCLRALARIGGGLLNPGRLGFFELLRRLGASISEQAEGFEVEGPVRLSGGTVRCHGDHRLEMSLAVAALSAADPTRLLGAGFSDVSFPGFWDLLPGRR